MTTDHNGGDISEVLARAMDARIEYNLSRGESLELSVQGRVCLITPCITDQFPYVADFKKSPAIGRGEPVSTTLYDVPCSVIPLLQRS